MESIFTNYSWFFMVRGSIFTNFTDMAFNFTYFFEEFLVRENNENFFRTLFLRTFFVLELYSTNFRKMTSSFTKKDLIFFNGDKFYEPFFRKKFFHPAKPLKLLSKLLMASNAATFLIPSKKPEKSRFLTNGSIFCELSATWKTRFFLL